MCNAYANESIFFAPVSGYVPEKKTKQAPAEQLSASSLVSIVREAKSAAPVVIAVGVAVAFVPVAAEAVVVVVLRHFWHRCILANTYKTDCW